MSVAHWRRRLVDAGTRLLLPEVCAGCGLSGSWICADCYKDVRILDPWNVCLRCGHPSGAGRSTCGRCQHWADQRFQIRSVGEFSGSLRRSIIRMKYQGEYARAGWHGEQVAELIADLGWYTDVLVPVPLHPKRIRRRGYNQSEKLADPVSRILGIDLLNALRRERDTAQQTSLDMHARRLNVAGAFCATQSLQGMNVLLIDDVTTTCSTLLECAAACWNAEADSVRAVTLASDV